MPRAARELDPGLDASEPARRPRGDPASGRPGDADTSSDSSDDDSCALIGVVNDPGAPLGVFENQEKKENCSADFEKTLFDHTPRVGRFSQS